MMPTNRTQTTLHIAVPLSYSAASGKVRVALLMTPRLTCQPGTATTLDQFPQWADFGTYSAGAKFNASYDRGRTTVPTTPVQVTPDATFWTKVFPSTTRVLPWTPESPSLDIRGYSHQALLTGINDALAHPPTALLPELPREHAPAPPPTSLSPTTPAYAAALQDYQAFWSAGKATGATIQSGFLSPDFHQVLGILGDHGPLLLRLGLLQVLETAAPPSGATSIVLIPTQTPTAPSNATTGVTTVQVMIPTTFNYLPTAGIFAPQPRDNDLTATLKVDLTQAGFSVTSLDVDGAAARFMTATTEGGLLNPATRSTGITLALSGRAAALAADLKTAKAHQDAVPSVQGVTANVTLAAEDVVRGYAFEVLDPYRRQWLSLSDRSVTYVPGTDATGFTAVDTAGLGPTPRAKDPANPDGPLLLSDVLARWDGWSLAVPRPGTYDSGSPTYYPAPPLPSPMAPPVAKLKMQTTVPTTSPLPVLRYGQSYSFRARAVDVSGLLVLTDTYGASAPYVHVRYDPVPAPFVIPPDPARLHRGESRLLMIVRSDPAANTREDPTSRILVPQRCSVDLAEQHGVFDAIDPTTQARYPNVDLRDRIAAADLAGLPASAGGSLPAGSAPEAVEVDWLADPLAATLGYSGAANGTLSFVPGVPSDPARPGWDVFGAWQSIAVVAAAAPPGFEPIDSQGNAGNQRVLNLGVAPGDTRRVQLASSPAGTLAGALAIPGLQQAPAGLTRAAALEGGHYPAATPAVTLTIVHAVKQPLANPSLLAIQTTRPAGSKDTAVSAQIGVDIATTGRVALLATWSEPVDGGPGTAPPTRLVVRDVSLGEATVDPEPLLPRKPLTGSFVGTDTKRRDLVLTPVATTRFVDEFRVAVVSRVTPVTGKPLALNLVGAPADKVVSVDSVRLLDPASGASFVRGKDWVITGTGSNRLVVWTAPTTPPVLIEGVPGPITTTDPVPHRVTIPASADPRPPLPLYAVPAATSTDGILSKSGKTVTATRGGPRLRVWLERPWWSSGDGEQLTVVCLAQGVRLDPAKTGNDATAGEQSLTLLGSDPALIGGGVGINPVIHTGTLDTQQAPAALHHHDVTYDAGRDLYWAEIGFDADLPAGTFARLVLARHQPVVSPGLKGLSQFVAMDPVQLLPQRTVTVVRTPGGLAARVYGPVSLSADGGRRTSLELSVQVHARPGDGDLGWDTLHKASVTPKSTKGFPPIRLAYSPAGGLKEASRTRLLVEEVEHWATVDDKGRAQGTVLPLPGASVSTAVVDLLGRRTTWLATLPVPRA